MELENLTVQNLEQLLHRYNTQTDNEVRAQIEEIINQWRNSNQAFPQSLEIIQSSQNENFVLFAIITLEFILRTKFGLFTGEHVNIIFTAAVGRLGTPLSERLSDNLLHLIAFTINSFPSTFEPFISQSHFDRPQLIPLLDYVYQISTDLYNKSESSDESIRYPLTEEQNEFHGKLYQMGEMFASELLQIDPSTITPHWVSFLKTLFGIIEDVSYFTQFLPYLQAACQNPNLIPSLLDFYSGENSSLCYTQNLEDKQEYYDFFKALIELYIALAEQMIGTHDETMLNYSSFIWKETIDLNFDFYGSEFVGLEFSEAVFTKFLECLTVFHQTDEDTFMQLLDTYANCIMYQSNMVSMEYKAPFILQAIDFFIAYVDQSPNISETCGDELDRITEVLMHNCLYGQDGTDDEDLKQKRIDDENEELSQKKTDYEQLLSIYLDNKYKSNELTNGVIYVFSFSPNNIIKQWANGILVQIFSMEEPPITSIYWIEKCIKYTPDSIDQQITLFYNLIPHSPLTEVSKVFFALTSKHPDKFLQNGDTLFAPLFELTAQVPMDSTSAFLMSSIFNALWSLAEQARTLGEAGEAFLNDNKEVFEQASTLFASKIGDKIRDLNHLKDLTDFLLLIIENSNNTNGSMSFFYSTLYQAIIGLYGPFFTSDDEQIQKDIMCNLISSCLNHGWIAEKQPIFDWITQLIQVTVFPEQLTVLSGLPEFLPSEPVNEYVLHGIQSQSYYLVPPIIDFFDSVLESDPNLFFTRIPANLSLMMLQGQSSIAIDRYYQFCDNLIVNAPMEQEAVGQFCQMIAARGFQGPFSDEWLKRSIIRLTLQILKHASQKYGITETVVQLIVQTLSLPTEEAAQFAAGFAQDNPLIFDEARKIVYRVLDS